MTRVLPLSLPLHNTQAGVVSKGPAPPHTALDGEVRRGCAVSSIICIRTAGHDGCTTMCVKLNDSQNGRLYVM
jgi:hypothetical protein